MAQKKLLYALIACVEYFSSEAYFEEKSCKNGCASKIFDENRHKFPSKPTNFANILVFVSFSMPDISLKELSEDKYGATLIIRGLHQGSFIKTREKILSISPNGLQLDSGTFQKIPRR
jgi:hypothetical protein